MALLLMLLFRSAATSFSHSVAFLAITLALEAISVLYFTVSLLVLRLSFNEKLGFEAQQSICPKKLLRTGRCKR